MPSLVVAKHQVMEQVLVRARAQQLRLSQEPQTKQNILNMALADTDQGLIVYVASPRLEQPVCRMLRCG